MMTYNIDLVNLTIDGGTRLVRTVTVEAESGWDATVQAADQITEAEESSVFATTPETL